jgi:hypothetical protein
LKNSNTYFSSTDENVIAKEIKEFINKIIDELDQNYPIFEKIMQEKVFVVED